MSAGSKLIEGAKEALAIAKGEQPTAAIWHNGFKYVREADERIAAAAVRYQGMTFSMPLVSISASGTSSGVFNDDRSR